MLNAILQAIEESPSETALYLTESGKKGTKTCHHDMWAGITVRHRATPLSVSKASAASSP
jgi:hypothetical protein